MTCQTGMPCWRQYLSVRRRQSVGRRLFEDPLLDTLVDRVQTENLDLKEADERVTEARAIARREGNTVSGSANLEANARDTIDTAEFDLSLNLDPFGRERFEANAALERLEAAQFNLKDAQLAVASEVMLAYVEIFGFSSKLSCSVCKT